LEYKNSFTLKTVRHPDVKEPDQDVLKKDGKSSDLLKAPESVEKK
jgi:hypothetical protein